MKILKANTYYKLYNDHLDHADHAEGYFNIYIHVKKTSPKSTFVVFDRIKLIIHLPSVSDVIYNNSTKPEKTVFVTLTFNETNKTQEEIIEEDYKEITKEEYENVARIAILKSYETLKLSSNQK